MMMITIKIITMVNITIRMLTSMMMMMMMIMMMMMMMLIIIIIIIMTMITIIHQQYHCYCQEENTPRRQKPSEYLDFRQKQFPPQRSEKLLAKPSR